MIRFYVSHSELKQKMIEELILLGGPVPFGFVLEELEQIDIVSSHLQIPALFIHGLHGRLGHG